MPEPVIPIYREQLPDGRMMWALSPTDMARVRAGYACGSCLQGFDMYQAACHLCGLPTQAVEFLPTPAHYKQSPADEDDTTDRRPLTMDDMVHTDTQLGEIGRWYKKKKGF